MWQSLRKYKGHNCELNDGQKYLGLLPFLRKVNDLCRKYVSQKMAESGVPIGEMSTFDVKKEIVGDKLQKRDDERLAEIERKREEKLINSSALESTSYFVTNFSKFKNDLESGLVACESLDKNKLVDHFDKLSTMHQQLQKFLTDSVMFLPAYDVQQAQTALGILSLNIQEKRDQMIPKKKFAFKSKKKQGTEKAIEPKAEKVSSNNSSDVVLADCKFTDKNGETLVMNEEINLKDVALANLDSCTVQLFGAPSAVHINKLTKCRVFCGPVSGSIFIQDCVNCVFIVACQQLRIHTTTNTKFYIHVTSRAIIEDCSTVQFGPYNWVYPSINEHYKISGLDRNRNSWNDIDDFNWLAADKHSPNWSILSPEEQNPKWE